MQTRQLGNSDLQITPILMGTWQAGKRMWTGIEDSESIAAIQGAVDAGITTIDTAEVYGEGHSEQIVGKAVGKRRDRVVYASKVFPTHLKHNQVIEACDRSLQNLNTDYIDLYQIHWPAGTWNSELVPISETMGALNQLKEQGKIRAIGVSNFNKDQLAEAQQYGRIDSLQPPYSLFWRQVEAELMPYCVEHNISILAYSSLAQGFLTGKFGPDHQFEEGDHRAKNKLYKPENYKRVQKALDELRPIAEAKNCTLAQLSLAWVIAQPQANAIAGARNSSQAEANAKAAEVTLTDDDLAKMDAISHQVVDRLDENPVLWEF
jgi:myo-inositol catabolism protein IolS